MKMRLVLGFALVFLSGCHTNNVMKQFALGGSTSELKKMEILDPDASRRDEGRLNDLDGEYGSAVMENYRKSAYEPKSARGSLDGFSMGQGSGGN
ncbi:hypothetical protein [Ferrimonas gelatinilytica]|uniref:Lipoprotein n=1 Tax=Ferrimonas gelatinilytica TaxID=1255257 RepID=A0ABP9S1K2_9GAMM